MTEMSVMSMADISVMTTSVMTSSVTTESPKRYVGEDHISDYCIAMTDMSAITL
jgi:hypothetical protein